MFVAEVAEECIYIHIYEDSKKVWIDSSSFSMSEWMNSSSKYF